MTVCSHLENKMHIVYTFTNNVNGKVYVGLTCQERFRKSAHKTATNSKPLYLAFKKYGYDSFTYKVVAKGLTRSEACVLEIKLIKRYDSYSNGYNLTTGGELNPGMVGSKHPRSILTEESAQLIIDSHLPGKQIAKELKISIFTVSNIRNGKSWKHLDRTKAPKYESALHRVADETKAIQVIHDPCSNGEACKKYNLKPSMVTVIRDGSAYVNLDRSKAPVYQHDVIKNHYSKVTKKQIKSIMLDSRSAKIIAKELGVHKSTIYKIIKKNKMIST